jgi:DNA-binding transcriptional LysR family regulator
MELRHLRYFVVTAEELHFTRAAARLNINQPPLSQQIRDLERELDLQLFHRVGRRIELTEAGALFLRDARGVLAQVERAKTSAQQVARGERGSLRIGFTGSACCHPLVPAAINGYRARYPDVELVLTEGPTSYLMGRLREGYVDVAFLRPNPADLQGLRARVVCDETLFVGLSAAHPLAGRSTLRLRELTGEPLLLPPRSVEPQSHDTVLAGCHTAGFKPSMIREVPQAASIINMVATGYGVGLVLESMRQWKPAGVVYIPIEGAALRVSLSVAWREANTSPASAHFLNMVGTVSTGASKQRRRRR